MTQVYIWGAGHYAWQVINEIDEKIHIAGILDNDETKQGTMLFHGIPVISPSDVVGKSFDYVVISVKKFQPVEIECRKLGISSEKVISYWKTENNSPVFKRRPERVEELLQEQKRLQYRIDSAPYEWGVKPSPRILGGAELLRTIIKEGSSLCRFGDGEFEMIREKERPWFQEPDALLSKRLTEVLDSQDDRIHIAISQNFTGFEQYTENAADVIREYMFGDTREDIIKLVDKDRIYYDAYVTRPYIIYRDKKNADEIFPLFREIWKERDVIIVEGEYARIGIGNDLMEHARSVSRILCPSKNAWGRYKDILDTVLRKVSRESLICISLGPCATVLAYDLAREGYQALDIGQLDNEYEWYLRGTERQTAIPGKLIAEVPEEQSLELTDDAEYMSQIIARIS